MSLKITKITEDTPRTEGARQCSIGTDKPDYKQSRTEKTICRLIDNNKELTAQALGEVYATASVTTMIYRLNSNDTDHLGLLYDDIEVIEKMGEDHLIQADPTPVEYADFWQTITVKFVNDGGKKNKTVPDIQHHFGHLFLSEKAATALSSLISGHGELLPVKYGDGLNGFIFNPLKIVSADPKQSTKNESGEVSFVAFSEEHAVFKTDFDDFFGVFCNQAFKDAIEENRLTGAAFEIDLSNIFGRDDLSEKPAPN